jgi:hypothetical protein
MLPSGYPYSYLCQLALWMQNLNQFKKCKQISKNMADEIRRRLRWENKERQRKKREEKGQLRDESLYLKRNVLCSSPPLTLSPLLKNKTNQQSFQVTVVAEPTLDLKFGHNKVEYSVSPHLPNQLNKSEVKNRPQNSCPSTKSQSINRYHIDQENEDDDDYDLVRDALLLAEKKKKIQAISQSNCEKEQPKNQIIKPSNEIIRRNSHDEDEDLIRDIQILQQKQRESNSSILKEKECFDLSPHEKVNGLTTSRRKSRHFISPLPDNQRQTWTLEEKQKDLNHLKDSINCYQHKTNNASNDDLPSSPRALQPLSNNESLWTDSDSEQSFGKKQKRASVSSIVGRKTIKKQRIISQKDISTTSSPTIRTDSQTSNPAQFQDFQERIIHKHQDGIDELMPYFERPKLGPPSDLVPLVLKHVDGQRRVPAAINRYLKGYQREGIVFLHNRIANHQGVIL